MKKEIDIKTDELMSVEFTCPDLDDLRVEYSGNIRDVIEAFRPDLLNAFDRWAVESWRESSEADIIRFKIRKLESKKKLSDNELSELNSLKYMLETFHKNK